MINKELFIIYFLVKDEVINMDKQYTEINSKIFDKWATEGWEWGQPINHKVFERAKNKEKIPPCLRNFRCKSL